MRSCFALLTMLLACSREKPNSTAPPEASAAAPLSRADAEADDAAAALRASYPIARMVVAQEHRASVCGAETVGFADLSACWESVAAKTSGYAAALPAPGSAKLACGQEIERSIRGFVEAQHRFHAARFDWLKARRTSVEPAMRGRALWKTCTAQKRLCDEPRPEAPEWEAASYQRISDIHCTRELFECLPGSDNVCWVNKVADRLGLGDNGKHGTLLVKATGKRID